MSNRYFADYRRGNIDELAIYDREENENGIVNVEVDFITLEEDNIDECVEYILKENNIKKEEVCDYTNLI